MKAKTDDSRSSKSKLVKLESSLSDAVKRHCKALKVPYSTTLADHVIEAMFAGLVEQVTDDRVAHHYSQMLDAEYEQAKRKLDREFESRRKRISEAANKSYGA